MWYKYLHNTGIVYEGESVCGRRISNYDMKREDGSIMPASPTKHASLLDRESAPNSPFSPFCPRNAPQLPIRQHPSFQSAPHQEWPTWKGQERHQRGASRWVVERGRTRAAVLRRLGRRARASYSQSRTWKWTARQSRQPVRQHQRCLCQPAVCLWSCMSACTKSNCKWKGSSLEKQTYQVQ